MKKEAPVKYPHSVNLFQFCRRVLDHKFGGIRVIDQDVGQILGFDPADCSHWKKGKKNIRSIQAMKSIADHLGVDEKLVVDVASGEVNEGEAFYEYSGYGNFAIEKQLYETAKKEFHQKNANTWTRDTENDFKKHFHLNEDRILALVDKIHERLDFNEAPLYLPEIVAAYPDIDLQSQDEDGMEKVESQMRGDKVEIRFPAQIKMKPYIRYQIAKAIGAYFFKQEGMLPPESLGEYGAHVQDVQTNIFAAYLLTPEKLLRQELQNVDVAKDIVSQLAETFWVSKAFMNKRLKDILAR